MKATNLNEKELNLLDELEEQRQLNAEEGERCSDFRLRACFAIVAKYLDLEGGRADWTDALKQDGFKYNERLNGSNFHC